MPFSRFAFPIRPIAAAVLSLAATFSQAAPLAIDLPAQALTTSIQQLSRQSGLSIGGDASLLEGKAAPAIRGKLEPADALRKLLEGSGLSVSFEGNKAVIGKSAPVLKEVVVVGDAPKEGSAAAGYRPETAKTTGPWGDRPILDTPYSITVIPEEMIENAIARNPDQLFKMAPLVRANQPTDQNNIVSASTRGFSVSRVYVNGVQNSNLGLGVFVEEMESLEILSGLSGFLYGASLVGGVMNASVKRPTAIPRYEVTAGNYGNEQYFAHADLGGPIDGEGKFGYRLNLMGQDGETNIKDQNLKRWLVSAALDWRPTDRVLIRFNAAKKEYDLSGRQTQFSFSNNPPPLAPLDGSKLYGPSDTLNNVESTNLGLNIDYKINEAIGLRAGWQQEEHIRSMIYTTTANSAEQAYAIPVQDLWE